MTDGYVMKAIILSPVDKKWKIWTNYGYEDSIFYHTTSMQLFAEFLPVEQCLQQNINTIHVQRIPIRA